MKSLIASIPRETTVIMIEHDMDTALDLAETVTLLNYGRVIVDGERDAVIADAANARGVSWRLTRSA